MTNPIIISLGGSLVAPDGVDADFIGAFRGIIEGRVALNERFVVIVGGGKVCRRYQEAARMLGVVSEEAQDWVGIYATRLNAELVRVAFGAFAHTAILTDPDVLSSVSAPVVVGAGWRPGHSTDFDAVEIAAATGAKVAVNLSNIDFVYNKDPKKFADAERIEKIDWTTFRRDFLPSRWEPGKNVPFDPIAAERADGLGLEVVIMNGKNLANFRNYLEHKKFVGTIIK